MVLCISIFHLKYYYEIKIALVASILCNPLFCDSFRSISPVFPREVHQVYPEITRKRFAKRKIAIVTRMCIVSGCSVFAPTIVYYFFFLQFLFFNYVALVMHCERKKIIYFTR